MKQALLDTLLQHLEFLDDHADRFGERLRQVGNPRKRRVFEDFLALIRRT